MDARAKMGHGGRELVYSRHTLRSEDGRESITYFNFSVGHLRLEINRRKGGRGNGLGFRRTFSDASQIEVIAEAPGFGDSGKVKLRVVGDETGGVNRTYAVSRTSGTAIRKGDQREQTKDVEHVKVRGTSKTYTIKTGFTSMRKLVEYANEFSEKVLGSYQHGETLKIKAL